MEKAYTKKLIKKHIDLDKKFHFASNIGTIHYKGFILIISVETAKWIVLDNEKQLNFFLLLKDNTLGEALNKIDAIDKIDAQKVIIQILAKDFECIDVHPVSSNRLHLYLTNACNLHCPHCYMYSGKKYNNELSTDEIKNILFNYKKNGGEHVTFSGGEVCTRTDLLDIVQYAYDLDLTSELLTNGTIWHKNLIEKIAPLIQRVQISIDGFNEIENAKIRGNGNFKKALDCVDAFLNYNTKTEIAMTPIFDETLKDNIKKYAEFGQMLLKKYKGKEFAVKYNGELLNGRNINLSDKQSFEYTKIVENILKQYSGLDYDDSFIKFHKNNGIQDNCLFGNLNISAIGDVYACPAITYLKPFANIRKDDFKQIMSKSLKLKKLSNVNNLEPCKDCELKYICGGSCRYKYFPALTKIKNMEETAIYKRKCNRKNKEFYYDLMIKTNKKLFV